jgi:hypothetical protein
MPRPPLGLPALAIGLSLALAGSAFAQSTLTLPPPGAGAAGDSPAVKMPAKKTQPRKRAAKPANDDALAMPGATKRPDTSTAAAKPRRFVPEEFDNGDDSGSPRPFMSDTGRAGLGMRF